MGQIGTMRFAAPAVVWLIVYASILVAWLAMALMVSDLPGYGLMRYTAPEIWEALCRSAAEANVAALFGMWALMSLAMMLPTFIPAISTFNDLGHAGAGGAAATIALVVGYLVVWFGFSTVAAIVQSYLAGLSLVGPDGASNSHLLTAGLLGLAGGYQFSRLKDACLSRCRSPITFFLENWSPGSVAALRMGATLGVACLGCCWALMLLGFVGGTMNLVWMGIATLFMAMEKLPQIGRYLTRPVGLLLLMSAILVGLRAVATI